MSNPPSYRTLAEQALTQAGAVLRDFPEGGLPVRAASAKYAAGQALATVAVAQALLHIGDLLREGFTRSGFDVEVD
jgi:hypothetical protein